MTRRAARVSKVQKHHFNPFVVIPTFFLGVITMFIAATVYAQINNEEITACVNNVNGNVRIPTAGSTCKNGESSLSWNKQGPQGPAGQAGSGGSTMSSPFFCTTCYLALLGDKFAGKDFSRSQISKSIFNGADLTGVNFQGSFLTGNQFNNANLTNANMSSILPITGWGIPQNNSFVGANLTGANMSNSLYHETKFMNANLQNTNFSNSTIRGGDFTGAQNMGSTDFTGATFENTKCVDGTNSDTHGGTCAGHF